MDADLAVGPDPAKMRCREFDETEEVNDGAWGVLRDRDGRGPRKDRKAIPVYIFRPPKIEVNEKYYIWGEIRCIATEIKGEMVCVHYHWESPNVVDCDFWVHYSTLRKHMRWRK